MCDFEANETARNRLESAVYRLPIDYVGFPPLTATATATAEAKFGSARPRDPKAASTETLAQPST
jgi:hypothetical protein